MNLHAQLNISSEFAGSLRELLHKFGIKCLQYTLAPMEDCDPFPTPQSYMGELNRDIAPTDEHDALRQ